MKKIIIAAIFSLQFFLVISCGFFKEEDSEFIADIDLEEIKTRGKLIAITGYNAYNYFIFRGQPMGFEYDLVKNFADHLGVDLEIIVERDINKMFELLNSGEGDLIAFNLTVTKDRSKRIAYTNHLNTIRQVLVQRRPDNWRDKKSHQIERRLIRNPIELEGKTVHVRSGSAFVQRLANLSDEIGGEINIIEAGPEQTVEDLIELVAAGEIDYTISDDNIARLSQAYFSNVDVNTYISFPQRIAWGVRRTSVMFLEELDKWIDSVKKGSDFHYTYEKYYINRNAYRSRLESQYFSKTGGKISQYDDIMKEVSKEINWDWRLLASLIFQESQFKNDLQSWAGATGLMQMMPQTAAQFGVNNINDPIESLKGGAAYLGYLDRFWQPMVTDEGERIKFVLASYNIGPGHILDARNLAEKHGSDPAVWAFNVETFLLKKSNAKYYNDPVVKLGYAKGIETVKYVREVLERYERYKQFINADD